MIFSSLRLLDLRLRRLSPYIGRIRYELLKWRFQSAGCRGSLGRKVQLAGAIDVRLGARVALRDGVLLAGTGRITVGDNSTINNECIIAAMEKVEIGANVMLAPRVYILDVDHRFESRATPIISQGYVIKPVVIEDDVWIGTGAVITKGVRIGKGAIIGSNSVVTRNIPPYSIAVGAPAKLIRERPE